MEYVDTHIIDCSRSNAKNKQEDNPALWTNELNNTIELKPGDKVSMYGSFISERGAGQENSVELRGETIGTKKIKYSKSTTTTKNYAYELGIPQNFQREADLPYTTTFDEVEETINLKDNEVNMVISFYKTMDALSYHQLPRRYLPIGTDSLIGGDHLDWSSFDSVTLGLPHRSPIPTTYTYDGTTRPSDVKNTFGYVKDDYKPIYSRVDPVGAAGPNGESNNYIRAPINNWVQNNDGTRYTVMVRNKTAHGVQKKFPVYNVSDVLRPQLFVDVDREFTAPYYARDPEFFDYKIYKKKITMNLDQGFNASSFIADELTKQAQSTTINETNSIKHALGETYRNPDFTPGQTEDPYNTQIEYPISKSAESETYQIFPCANNTTNDRVKYNTSINNVVEDGTEPDDPTIFPTALEPDPTNLNRYIVNDISEFTSVPYYESLQFIACKRPEIYEAGSKLNDIFGLHLPEYLPGFGLNDLHFKDYERGGLVTSLDYTEANCKLIKEFVESQALYPELFSQENIINMYQDDGTAFNIGPPVQPSTSGETTNPYYKITRTINDDEFDDLVIKARTYNETITMNATINNSRFFHMNADINKYTNGILDDDDRFNLTYKQYAQLGCSYYDWRGTHDNNGTIEYNTPTLDYERHSLPFLVYYDPTQKDKFYELPDTLGYADSLGNRVNKFTYGCIGRYDYLDPTHGTPHSKIVLFPNKILRSDGVTGCGLPDKLFKGGLIEWGRKLGFDRHWNAWSTCCISLSSGIEKENYSEDTNGTNINQFQSVIGTGIAGPNDIKPTYQTQKNLTNFSNSLGKMYLGADKFNIGFDGQHFFFSELHTALNLGDLADSETGGIAGDGGSICYKINPEQKYNNFSPVQLPYESTHSVNYVDDPGGATARNITRLNQNITPWAVFDTTTGIFIEDFGYDLNSWEECLWKKLGFSYEQLHDTTSNRFTRYNNFPTSVAKPTTNAKIDVSDTKEWNQNRFFNPMYDGTLAHSKTIKFTTGGVGNEFFYRMLPQITITNIQSIKILATDYPITSFKGFYTIRSDIITDTKYAGNNGDTAMSVIGVVDKIYPVNDFITGSSAPINFTITAPRTLSSVKVAITDPDGKYSIVDGNSSILFKIDRLRRLDTNVAQEIRDKLQKKN